MHQKSKFTAGASSVVTAIRSLPAATIDRAFIHVAPRDQLVLPVPTARSFEQIQKAGNFGDGLHKAFSTYARDGECSSLFRPYVTTLSRWLDAQGVGRLLADWTYYRKGGMPAGTLDALMVQNAGPRRGVLELKTTEDNGSIPRAEHLCQVGSYLTLQANWDNIAGINQWAVLAYACLRKRQWHLHVFNDVRRLAAPAEHLLAA